MDRLLVVHEQLTVWSGVLLKELMFLQLNFCCSQYSNTAGCVWIDCLLCSEQLTDCVERSSLKELMFLQINGCCSQYSNTVGCVWIDCLICSEQLTDCVERCAS